MNEEVWFVYLTFACCTNKEMLQCLVMIQDNTVSDSCQKKKYSIYNIPKCNFTMKLKLYAIICK